MDTKHYGRPFRSKKFFNSPVKVLRLSFENSIFFNLNIYIHAQHFWRSILFFLTIFELPSFHSPFIRFYGQSKFSILHKSKCCRFSRFFFFCRCLDAKNSSHKVPSAPVSLRKLFSCLTIRALHR